MAINVGMAGAGRMATRHVRGFRAAGAGAAAVAGPDPAAAATRTWKGPRV